MKALDKHTFLASWSGGKDSCFAMMEEVKEGNKPAVLLNMMNENGLISRSHAIPLNILRRQGIELGLPVITIPSTWTDYEHNFIDALKLARDQYCISAAVFGDLDFEANRAWEEKVCATAEIVPMLPLWKQDRKKLVLRMLAQGMHCIIVSCNQQLGEPFLGRKLDEQLIEELEQQGVDVCGENGEYHTLVVNCPLFSKEIGIRLKDKKCYGNYWFQEMEMIDG